MRLYRPEFKFVDTQLTASIITSTASIMQLTNISQGDTQQSRTGNMIRMVSWSVKVQVKINQTANTDASVRIILVQDRQTNGAIFTAANLLTDTTISDSLVSPLQLNSRMRLKVWKNWVLSTSIEGNHVVYKKFYKKMNIPIVYESNNGDITDLRSNSFAILLISDQATNGPGCTVFSRMRFVDS